jgi:hypothetical protein
MGMRKTAIVVLMALAGMSAPLQRGVSFAQPAPDMGELSHEPLVRLEAGQNSSNQPQPDPTRADGATSREA